MVETVIREIKIYCPTHQSVFDVEEKPQIVCEIREHSLANNFPHSEFWEYCCDCQIFSPSSFGTGGKVKNTCRHCERLIARRFLCDECKIVSYDSDEDTKGKKFGIGAEGFKPTCPGCRKSFGETHANQHQCSDIEGTLMTHRAQCPFCQKLTFAKNSSPKQVEPIVNSDLNIGSTGKVSSTQCPNCGNWGFAGRIHCGKCGIQINAPAEGIAPGTTSPRTQLLGSICPNCGTGNQAGSSFCNNCGQALKISQKTPPENITQSVNFNLPPPPPLPNPQATIPVGAQTLSPGDFQLQNSSVGSNKTALWVVSGLLFLVFIGVIIAYNAKTSNNELSKNTNNSVSQAKNVPSKTSDVKPANRSADNTSFRPADNTSSPIVGHKGRLITNSNIRGTAGTDGEIRGTHYEDAQLEILGVSSFYNNKGEYVTWYRVRILKDGCDRVDGNGCGNNWERNGDKGYGEADTEGWIYSGSIRLD